jgi:hypothetical protein
MEHAADSFHIFLLSRSLKKMPSPHPTANNGGSPPPLSIFDDASKDRIIDDASRVSREVCSVGGTPPSVSSITDLDAPSGQPLHLLSAGELLHALMPGPQRSRQPDVQASNPNSSPAPSLTLSDVSSFSDSVVEGLAEEVASFSVSDESNPNSPPTAPVAKNCNAKDELHKYYAQKDDVLLLKKSKNFVSWNDGDRDHVLLWTSYFIAPEGVCIPAGRLIQCDEAMYTPVDGLHWYGTKAEAMRAAAGRAMDCFLFRDRGRPSNRSALRHCEETPVWPMPANMPVQYLEAADEIEDLLQRFA